MNKFFIYIFSLFVVFYNSESAEKFFTKLPSSVDGVLYAYNSPNSSVYLRKNGFSLVAKQRIENITAINESKSIESYELHRVDFDFVNPNNLHIESNDIENNRFVVLNSSTYKLLETKEILYSNIYDGIDFRAYFNKEGNFEFDFIVHPKSNPEKINLLQKFSNSSKLSAKNELEIGVEFGSMLLNAPYSYQGELTNAEHIESSYVLKGDTITFALGEYDKNEILVIDPIARIMGSYFGSQANEAAYDVEEDASGNYYITGYTESPTNIAHSGYQVIHGGLKDAYLAKFNSNDNRIWSTYFGDMGVDIANDLKIDNQGNIIIVGETGSTSNIATPTAHQLTFGGGISDGFVAKFLANGNLLWATYYGGQKSDSMTGVTTDNNNNIYVVGYTQSENNIFFNGHQLQNGGMNDAFVVKFNPLGNRIWGAYFGGASDDFGYDIALDANNNVFIVGSTESDNNIAVQANVPNRQGQTDAFITSFDTDGFIRWSTYYGGSSDDVALAIESDGYYIYFGGKTKSFNGISLNGFQNSIGGGWDGFLVKYDFFQNQFWATYYGGTGNDYINSVDVNGSNVYTVGSTNSTNNINFLGWQQIFGGGSSDGTFAKYNSTGAMEWSTYYGGSGFDELYGVSANNKIYITGLTNSKNNIGYNGFNNSHSGLYDALIAEMTEAELRLLLDQPEYCANKEYSFSVDFINMDFAPNNEFIVELSDELGKFDNPQIIGRKTSSNKTNVTVRMPDLEDYSTKYRLKIRSTNPVFEGTVNLDSITIYPKPRIINSSDPLCVNSVKVFSAQKINNVNYSWFFEKGIVINGSDLVNNVRWDSAGTYKVMLISENPICTDTTSKTVTVNELPDVKFFGNNNVCGFSLETYTIVDMKDYVYLWNATEGTVVDKDENGSATIRWNNVSKPGQVILVATDTATGCITTETLDVLINEKPNATLTGADTTCRGCIESVFTETKGISNWKVSGGNIVKEYELQLDYKPNDDADSVVIRLIKTSENSNCTDTVTKVIYLIDSPTIVINGENSVCENRTYSYTTSANNEYINSWSVAGGEILHQTNSKIDVKWGIAGIGAVKLIRQTKDLLQKDSIEISITIIESPDTVDHNLPSTVCSGDTIYLDFKLKPGQEGLIKIDGKTYKEKYIVMQTQPFVVEAIVVNSMNCDISELIEIDVFPVPQAPILKLIDQTIFSSNSGLHRWYLEGELLDGETGNKLLNPDEGVYRAQYRAENCWSDFSEEFVYSLSNVENIDLTGVKFFTNPNKNYLQIESQISIDKLIIVDLLGKEIININKNISEKIDISNLDSGIYFVRLELGNKVLTYKFIKE